MAEEVRKRDGDGEGDSGERELSDKQGNAECWVQLKPAPSVLSLCLWPCDATKQDGIDDGSFI